MTPDDLSLFWGWLCTQPTRVRLSPNWLSYQQALELCRMGKVRFEEDEDGEYCVAVQGFCRIAVREEDDSE